MTDPNLDTCATEPIHIPGAVQPHGVLFVCSGAELIVRQVSSNVSEHFGAELDHVLDRSLLALLDDAGQAALLARTRSGPITFNPIDVRDRTGRRFDAILHEASDGRLLIEMEPVPEAGADVGLDHRLRASVRRLQHARDARTLCDIAATEVRAITGFDRVMVYRFDRDWNGEVVAEDKRADLEPFLGLHYPASDIPAQARRLYTVNWLRFIADVNYRPAPLVPPLDPVTGAPLDLSFSVLRSVSPIHLEYLRNMGVSASMSVSLVIDGVLTGLIACHHYDGPRRVPYRSRDTAEYLGQALSWHLRTFETADRAEMARVTQVHESALVRALVESGDLLHGLAIPALLDLVGAQGAVVVLQDGIRRIGSCPPPALVADLVRWLVSEQHDVFSTDHLAEHVPGAAAADATAAGMLAVAISRDLAEYLLWFRPSTEQTVSWAGDPRKQGVAARGQEPPRLSPRGSFDLWRETVRGRSRPWEPWQTEAAAGLRQTLLSGVRVRAAQLRRMNDHLLEADRAKDSFIALVGHELRTPLNAIVGWAQLLQGGSLATDRWSHAVDVIARNAQAQAQIIEDLLDVSRMVSGTMTMDAQTLDLSALVEGVLDSMALAIRAKELRLKRTLDSSAALVLGDETRLRQVVANLLTNAIKFTPKGGSITVALRRDGSDLEFAITDTGQGIAPAFLPHVFEAFKQADPLASRRTQGLGLGLAIVRKLVELHGGRVETESPGLGQGATFRVRLPLAPVRPPAQLASASGRFARPSTHPTVLAGVTCLVVEDERDSRELVSYILGQAGASVVDAADVVQALQIVASRSINVIVSDIGLPDQDGLSFIRGVRASPDARVNGLPAVALTAFTRAVDRTTSLQAGFNAHVPKPVDATELVTVIASICGRLLR